MTDDHPDHWDSSRNAAVAEAINKQHSLTSNLRSRWRWLSAVMGAAYVIIGAAAGGFALALRVVASLLIPMAAIWFPDEIGSYIGGRITHRSPGWAVRVVGWAVLFMPIAAIFIIWARS